MEKTWRLVRIIYRMLIVIVKIFQPWQNNLNILRFPEPRGAWEGRKKRGQFFLNRKGMLILADLPRYSENFSLTLLTGT
jgi:hypothetical protein